MDLLLDPNIAYLLLAGGLVFAILALLSPGTGLLEIIALFTLLMAGWGVYNLPINPWALVVLAVGAGLFVFSIWKAKGRWIYLAVAIVALVLGSVFIFRGEAWWQPAVNPFLAGGVSIASGVFFWVATRKVLEARSRGPAHDLKGLIGAIGEAKTEIQEEGSIQVASELWSARSKQRIPPGTPVRVVGREGFILEVEEIGQNS
jgi:membrane-bound serine protease (ClpP class)